MSKKLKNNRRKWRHQGGKAAFELGAMLGGTTKLTAQQMRWATKGHK